MELVLKTTPMAIMIHFILLATTTMILLQMMVVDPSQAELLAESFYWSLSLLLFVTLKKRESIKQPYNNNKLLIKIKIKTQLLLSIRASNRHTDSLMDSNLMDNNLMDNNLTDNNPLMVSQFTIRAILLSKDLSSLHLDLSFIKY